MVIEKILDETQSVCEGSLDRVKSLVIERNGRVYLQKHCPLHGISESLHIFDDPDLYLAMRKIFCDEAVRRAYPRELVVYLTGQCNSRCRVCYINANGPGIKELSLDDVLQSIKNYQGKYVHLSGGEPTLRKDLFDIIKAVKKEGFAVGVFSNGVRLADKNYVRELAKQKLDLLIMSMQSLRDEDYQVLIGEEVLAQKLSAVQNVIDARIPLYLFCYIAPGVNEDQIVPLVSFVKENFAGLDIINFTPVWQIGRSGGNPRISASSIFAQLKLAGLDMRDMLTCTAFSHVMFECLSMMTGRQWVRQPPCEQMIYLIDTGGGIFNLTELFDLRLVADRLLRVNKGISGRNMLMKWAIFLFRMPWCYLVGRMFSDRRLRKLMASILEDLFKRKSLLQIIRMRKLTIMTGQVHGLKDADLRFLDRCTLYAVNDNGKGFQSFCLRQMRDELRRKG